MSLCATPEAPKRIPISRSPHCEIAKKRRRIGFSPLLPSSSLTSSFNSYPSPHPSTDSADLSFMGKNFVVLRKLGEGDFGEVKEIQSRSSSEMFAIKISKVDKMKVKTGLHYTRTHLEEVRVHSSIPPHSNLLQFHSAWKEDGYVHMLMELCDDSLEGYCRKKTRLTQVDVHSICRDMILALRHLSSLNFAHLDVKPANILRCTNGVYKLADFSVTVNLNKMDAHSGEFGDGRFAAPELLSNQFTPKADIFSLGVSLSVVSVSIESPLTSSEWSTMKEEGKLPDRVSNALSGPLEVNKIVQSMLLPISSRPTAHDIDLGEGIDSAPTTVELKNMINTPPRKRSRLSLSSSAERAMRNNASPLVKDHENSGVIFHTNERFFEMERSKLKMRSSMGVIRRSLVFKKTFDEN